MCAKDARSMDCSVPENVRAKDARSRDCSVQQ